MPAPNPIRSMTGFSSIEGDALGMRVRVELKSLNHRFLDARIRLPRELFSAEYGIRQWLQAELKRGSVDFKIEKLSANDDSIPFELNLAAAKNYSQALESLAQSLGKANDVSISQIAQAPDIITRACSDPGAEKAWSSIEPLLAKTLSVFNESRSREGDKLRQLLLAALSDIESKIEQIRSKREALRTALPGKTREKLSRIFQASPIEGAPIQAVLESRTAQELALLADRTDIEEELSRFRAHLEEFGLVLKKGGTCGKKLEFLLQELGREVNTLGNKAQDFEISREAVDIKVSLEQMREQVLNLE